MSYDLTSLPELPSLHEHPVYTQGMAHIAAGQWDLAFRSFQLLQRVYPDNAEVNELLNAAQMRAALAGVEPRHTSRVTKKRLNARRLFFGTLVAIVVTLAAYVIYEVWINPEIVQELRLRQITSLRNEADEAIVAGDYAKARQALQKLQAIFPEDPQTIQALQRVEQVERLSALYDEAKAHMKAGSWDQAVEALTELQSLDAGYRDLPQLLQAAQESRDLDRQFQAADEAFARGDWPGAIAQYEALRQASLTFRFEEIQARLFDSHLKYGQTLLEEAGADPNQVSEAISHFSEALKLQPMQAEALKERHLAEVYLSSLNAVDQDEVIDLLLMIYDQRPGYAGKEAAQRLYTKLLARAESFLSAGDKAAAIADYQAAAQLQVEDTSQAEHKLADLTAETSP